jgi:hypothetical protein
MARRVLVSATIDGFDDEVLTAPELGHQELAQETILSDYQPQNVLKMELRWGGECRVELHLIGQQAEDGTIRIDGNAKLFEGSSEDTDDLDGEIDFTFDVPAGETVVDEQTVMNEDEGGDYADIKITVANKQAAG